MRYANLYNFEISHDGICRKEESWEFRQIKEHQYKMLDILFGE